MIYLSSEVPSALFPAGHHYFGESPEHEDQTGDEATISQQPEAASALLQLSNEPIVQESEAIRFAGESSERGAHRYRRSDTYQPESAALAAQRLEGFSSQRDLPIMEHYLDCHTDSSDAEIGAAKPSRFTASQFAGRVPTIESSSDEEMISQEVKKNRLPLSDESEDEQVQVPAKKLAAKSRATRKGGSANHESMDQPAAKKKVAASKKQGSSSVVVPSVSRKRKIKELKNYEKVGGKKQQAAEEEPEPEAEAEAGPAASKQKVTPLKVKDLKAAAATRKKRAAAVGDYESEDDSETDDQLDEYEDEYDDDCYDDGYDDGDESEYDEASSDEEARKKLRGSQSSLASRSSKSLKGCLIDTFKELMARRRRRGLRRRSRRRVGKRRRSSTRGVRKASRLRAAGRVTKNVASRLFKKLLSAF